jgi:hypothetical protein
MADFYAQVGEPTQWCLVHQYADGSAVLSIWGPFPDQITAATAEPLMSDVIENGVWKTMPLRRVLVNPALATPKPPATRSAMASAAMTLAQAKE